MSRRAIVLWIVLIAAAGTSAFLYWARAHNWRPSGTTLQGAVIRQDTDTHKETPIAGVLVTASRGTTFVSTQSDSSGYFKIIFPGVIWPGQTLSLAFRAEGYEPLDLEMSIRFRSTTRQLVVAAMKPVMPRAAGGGRAPIVVSNIRVRYTVNSETDENIGSAVRTFQVINRANVPCRRQAPCSPDGYWKAGIGSVELDAGVGNEFRDARVSCIAGPCPFTRIDSNSLADGGRTIRVTAQDWSDTATFLLEAEVFRASIVANVRESYPAIFGQTLNFTAPPTAEGPTLEAELNGVPIVFPLGPGLYLDWARCSVRAHAGADKPAVYECELKPGYRF